MNSEITEYIESWPSSTLPQNETLQSLTNDFTGAVNAGQTWVFLVNKRIIAEVGGDRSDVEARRATAYTAPEPVYPLLFAMREEGGQTQAEYFTGNTSIEEADAQLSSGDFAGYIELSEDVLSGDYYGVYYGDKSMYVGFLGDGEIITGSEAFERANNEVGVYEVISVELDVEVVEDTETTVEKETSSDTAPENTSSTSGDSSEDSDGYEWAIDMDSDQTEPSANNGSDQSEDRSPSPSNSMQADEQESEQLPAAESNGHDSEDEQRGGESSDAGDDFEKLKQQEDTDVAVEIPEEVAEEVVTDPDEFVREDALKDVYDQLTELADRVDSNETGVQHMQDQIAQLVERVEQLSKRQREIEEQLEAVTAGHEPEDEEQETTSNEKSELGVDEALSQIDVFIRYESRAEATIEMASANEATREEVNQNLQFETHTQFDPDEYLIDGMEYTEFLEGRIAYQFVQYVATELLYEMKETNNEQGLHDLYESIPRMNRVEFNGTVDVNDEDIHFDLVIRDQKGRPLIVADTEEGHQPVTEERVEELISKAGLVSGEHDRLGAAVFLASSFYESGALDVADSATKSGLISRKKNVVKSGRGDGFHLCLFEGRDSSFHMTMPEL